MDAAAKREFKNAIFGQFARIGSALSNGRRLELLELLAQRERSVEDLAVETRTSVANASKHLQALRQARLVEGRKAGTHVHYRLADSGVLKLWLTLREVGEARLAEVRELVEEYLGGRKALEAIGLEELRTRHEEGRVVILDVRPGAEYEAGHITNAHSIPLDELKRRLKELPKNKTVVAYCRGPYCLMTDEAVSLLRAEGYRALRLECGYPEWKQTEASA